MRDGSFEAEGFAFYVDEARRGSVDPYVAYRIYEKHWRVEREDRGVLRQVTIRLIEADPWFLATASPLSLSALETEDLDRLTPFVGVGPARKAAAMLRATLWYWGRRGPYHPDRAGRAQLLRALVFLQQVGTKQRDRTWHEMLTGCYRVLDYTAYKRAFAKLLEKTPPEWRASGLHDFLRRVAAKKDWRVYDRYRPAWGRLPPGHHACECYINDLHTNDGLRAVAAKKWDAIPGALIRAGTVRGCAHLNTGGLNLDLVRVLIAKRKHLDAARAYLEVAAGFEVGGEAVAALQKKLASAIRRDGRGAPRAM